MRTGWFKVETDAAAYKRVRSILMSRFNLKYKRGPRKGAKQTEVEEPAQDEESANDEEPLKDEEPPRHESSAKDKSPVKDEEPPKDAANPWTIETVELSKLIGRLDRVDSEIVEKYIIKAEVYNKGRADQQYGMRCKSRQSCNSLSILTLVTLFFRFHSSGQSYKG